MGKPTEQELEEALGVAGRMRESGKDPHCVAKALLNLHYRIRYLERVQRAAEIYLRSGQGTREHRELLKAIEEAKAADLRSSGADVESTGLRPGDSGHWRAR